MPHRFEDAVLQLRFESCGTVEVDHVLPGLVTSLRQDVPGVDAARHVVGTGSPPQPVGVELLLDGPRRVLPFAPPQKYKNGTTPPLMRSEGGPADYAGDSREIDIPRRLSAGHAPQTSHPYTSTPSPSPSAISLMTSWTFSMAAFRSWALTCPCP